MLPQLRAGLGTPPRRAGDEERRGGWLWYSRGLPRHTGARGNTDSPGLYHGYVEDHYGEQFVCTFDRVTKTGTVSGGDLVWGDPKLFTLGQLEEVFRDIRKVAAQVVGQGDAPRHRTCQ